MNATDFLDDPGRAAVLEAVKRAEARTSAEVVCAVATESGRYDRAESVVGLFLALVGLGLADVAWSLGVPADGWPEPTPLSALALGVVLGATAGTVLASFVHPLRRLVVSRAEMDEEVARSAAAAFTDLRVGTTAGHTGILVYVSLFERTVIVLLDEAVSTAAGDGFAQQLCASAVRGLKGGARAQVFVDLIDAATEALAAKLPPRPGDVNELPDRLVVLHPR